MKGKVKMFDVKKGYGFIRAEDNTDVFFHYSSIVMDGFKTATQGDEVEFDRTDTEKGLRASNVKIVKHAETAPAPAPAPAPAAAEPEDESQKL